MRWKLALVQHPMYLIIREDSMCAERTPPWGAATIMDYIERVRQNLATLRRHPDLVMGYEWSAVELELLAQDAPDVVDELRTLAQEGKVSFHNPTYSQPHLQTLSSEANWRQLEYGTAVYRDLFGQEVRSYAHQEASVHDQVPQLLRAFGVRFAVTPFFYWTLAWLDEGELVFHGWFGLRFVHGHEFVAWHGLDGTDIPLYLQPSPTCDTNQDQPSGLLHVPPLRIHTPDMIAVDDSWLAQHSQEEIALLDDMLAERLAECPPRAHARLYSDWSYIEGMRAEELSRHNWQAEASVLRAEALNALAFALTRRPARPTDRIWKTILTTQHHDVYCFCGPVLKAKSIARLQGAVHDATHLADEAAGAIVSRIECSSSFGKPVAVFNTLPHRQKGIVRLQLAAGNAVVIDHKGDTVPSESVPSGDGTSQVSFLGEMPGMGYATYYVRSGDGAVEESVVSGSFDFENGFYRARIEPDATLTALAVKPAGDELLDTGQIRGNQLAAMDSTGISPKYDGPADIVHRRTWEPPKPGPELHWEPAEATRIRRSSLGVTLLASGRMGDRVEAAAAVRFYHDLPRIDVTWILRFDTACVGTFFDDESKLRVQWPLSFAGDIYHDIAFGVVRHWPERPFFPASWADISDGAKGLAYLHHGTPKHWVRGRTLVNLFAWGEDTDAIGNRVEPYRWLKSFDQRLRGVHVIEYALYPHSGDWRSADVIGVARGYGCPPVAYGTDAHTGDLPPSLNILALTDAGMSTTAVKVEDSQVLCRVYAATGEAATAEADAQGLEVVGLRSLGGEPLSALGPFQIGELILRPRR